MVVVIGHRQGFINTVPPLATSTLAVGKITEGAVAIFRGAAANPVVVHDGFIMFWDLAPPLGTPVLLVRGADNVGPCVPILVEDRLVLLGVDVLRVVPHTSVLAGQSLHPGVCLEISVHPFNSAVDISQSGSGLSRC